MIQNVFREVAKNFWQQIVFGSAPVSSQFLFNIIKAIAIPNISAGKIPELVSKNSPLPLLIHLLLLIIRQLCYYIYSKVIFLFKIFIWLIYMTKATRKLN